MLKKRALSIVLAALMLLVLLPLTNAAKAETLITSVTLSSSANIDAPQAGDPITFPTDKLSVAATTPQGLHSIPQISSEWYDSVHGTHYAQNQTGTFTPGRWWLTITLQINDSGYAFDEDSPDFQLSATVTIGGQTFSVGSVAPKYLTYSTYFDIDDTGCPPVFEEHTLNAEVRVGDSYHKQFVATGEAPITYSYTGTLPTGLSLSADGLLSGTFTEAGSFLFKIVATNANGSDGVLCGFTVKETTLIERFTLATTADLTAIQLGDPITCPTNTLSIASIVPAGLASKLKFRTFWHDSRSGKTYNEGDAGTITNGEWILYIFVEPINDDYAFDVTSADFASGGALEHITLGGKEFTLSSLDKSYVGYHTAYCFGLTPEVIDVTYDTDVLPYVTHRMTYAEVTERFRSAITAPMSPAAAEEGWFVTTTGDMIGFCEDAGDPGDTMYSAMYLNAFETYFLSTLIAVDTPRFDWYDPNDQDFTVNGSGADVFISPYEVDGVQMWQVSLAIECKCDLSDATVDGVQNAQYAGEPITLSGFTVRFGGVVLVEGTDFTVSYLNNTDVGVATMILTGKGRCVGTKEMTFTIQPNPDRAYTIAFDPADVQYKGATPYVVFYGTPQTPHVIVKDYYDNVLDPAEYTVEYLENGRPGTGYARVSRNGVEIGTAWFKIYLPATDYTMVENRDGGIYLEWHAVEGAAGYVIYRRAWNLVSAGWTDFVRWNNTTELSWTDTAVYAGTRYQYGIKAYFESRVDPVSGATIGGNVGDNYNLGVVGPLKTTVRITTRKLNRISGGPNQITAKWTGSSLFTGYELQLATDVNFTKNVKTVKIADAATYRKTVSKLKSNTRYYVRIRSYHDFEGMTYCGAWSNVLNTRTK